MGIKLKSLNDLLNKGVNVHYFESINELSDLIKYADNNDKFSMRFDRDKDYYHLPFYKYKKEDFSDINKRNKYFEEIIKEAKELNCSLLCANGYLYDEIQICNFVIKIDSKSSFVLEFSTKQVSLREMYEYETTIIKGNIKDSLKDMEWIKKSSNIIDDRNIEKIISWSFKLNIVNKNIEATLYKEKVGMLKEDIACWQID